MLMFKPFQVADGTVPELVEYIFLVYSNKSDLNNSEPFRSNQTMRKEKAAKESGLAEKHHGDVFSLRDELAYEMCMALLRAENDIAWAHLVTCENMFWSNMLRLNQPINTNTVTIEEEGETVKKKSSSAKDDKTELEALNLKTKLRIENGELVKAISAARTEFFKNAPDVKEKESQSKILYRPEIVAKRGK